MTDSADRLAFDPVISARDRHDGWTPERQRGFIEALATIGVVSAAAKSVGISPKSAYALLKRAGADSSFAAAWALAQREGRSRALDTAIARTFDGIATPIFYRGKQVGERRRYNDGLLIAALRYASPDALKPVGKRTPPPADVSREST